MALARFPCDRDRFARDGAQLGLTRLRNLAPMTRSVNHLAKTAPFDMSWIAYEAATPIVAVTPGIDTWEARCQVVFETAIAPATSLVTVAGDRTCWRRELKDRR